MEYNTTELCSIYTDLVDVVEPIFSNYGGRHSFGGKVVTIETAAENGWEGIVCYGSVCNVDVLEQIDIGIQSLVSIPVCASGSDAGESDLAINFGGVTFLPDDYLYADNTGIILSPDPLDVSDS